MLANKLPKFETGLLAGMAAFLVLVPWFAFTGLGADVMIVVDGIASSAVIVLMISIVLALASWAVLSCATKNISPQGIALGFIAGASLVMPFLQILGPMGGAVVGVVAGFAAFLFQKRIANHQGRPLVAAAVVLASAYFVLTAIALVLPVTTSVWDTGDGIGAWQGTVGGLETSGFNDVLYGSVDFVLLAIAVPFLVAAGLVVRR